MKKYYIFFLVCFATESIVAQVGINTTNPKAQLEIKSSSETTPTITDGLLIPKVNTFPVTNPTIDQQGMLVYLKNVSGTDQPGFYYWDFGTLDWIPIGNNNSTGWNIIGNEGTTTATNFIGTTDDVDIIFKRNNVRAGLLGISNTSFGLNALGNNTTGSNNTATGKFALRNNTTGFNNTASGLSALRNNTTGNDNTASGDGALFLNTTGFNNTANGADALVLNTVGENNTANGTQALLNNTSGNFNTANGVNALSLNTIGSENTSLGYLSNVVFTNLNNATAIGARATVNANNSLVLGSINGINGATASVNVGIGTQIPLDKLHVVGNIRMVDGNQSIGRVLTSDANGTATWTNPIGTTNGTLDQAYDFGGAGLGKIITADAGAVLINGTDGFVSTGTTGVGALAPSGSGVKMFWNPRKAAFRAGQASGTSWDDANVGQNSVAMGFGSIASGNTSTAFGSGSSALGMGSVAFGWSARANATQSTAFGLATNANSIFSTAFGYESITSGRASTSFGVSNEAESFGETALGIGATSYAASANGANQFRAANATDRLLVIGNATDADNDDAVDDVERSDALIILKNGLTRLPSTTNAMITAADGKAVVTKEYLQSNTSAWGLTGNAATNATTNFIGTIDNQSVSLRTNNTERVRVLSTGEVGIGTSTPTRKLHLQDNTTSTTVGQLYLEQSGTGDALMHFGNTGARHFNLGLDTSDDSFKIGTSATIPTAVTTGTLMKIQATGEVGIGTTTPDRKLEVSGPAGLVATRITNTSTTGTTSNVALEFFRASPANTDWQIFNVGPNLTIGNSADDLATVNDLYQFQGARFMPMTDATINLGQTANRWNTLFASNGTINTSDAREKKNIQNINYGLKDLMLLRPVSFNWKKDDGSGTKLGLIAQELQQVIPEVVRDWDWQEDEHGNRIKIPASILGVYYSDLIPVLIKSIQEQQTIIDTQNEENNILKIKIEAQAKTIEAILNRLETLESKK